MKVFVFPNREAMSEAAARHVASSLSGAIAAQGDVRMVPATAGSQLDFQRALIRQPGIDWSGVEVFHSTSTSDSRTTIPPVFAPCSART